MMQPPIDFGVSAVPAGSSGSALTASVGDHIVIEARLSEGPMPGTLTDTVNIIPLNNTLPENLKIIKEEWDGGLTYRWELVPIFGGQFQVQLGLASILAAEPTLVPADTRSITVTASASADWFLKELDLAKKTLDTFYKQGAAWLPKVWQNYKAAYDTFGAAISDQEAADKRANDIVLGILFAGLAGVGGGMVGAVVEHWLEREGRWSDAQTMKW